MNDKLRGGLIAVAAIAALAGGAAIAGASGSGSSSSSSGPTADSEQSTPAEESGAADEGGRDDGAGQPVTGSPLDRASAVALQQTGGGKVTGSEIRDEEGFYEIEVTKDDGSQIDVHLDQNYNVIDASGDGGG